MKVPKKKGKKVNDEPATTQPRIVNRECLGCDSAVSKNAMTASCFSALRLQTLSAPGVLPEIFPQDKWKSAISFKHPINMSYKTHHKSAPKAQFYCACCCRE